MFLAYTSSTGHALIDRELYVPKSWTDDPARCAAPGIPEGMGLRTKPELAQVIVQRALDAGVPFGWVTADEAYGQVKYLRVWLEERDIPYVLATRRNDDMITTDWGSARADHLIAALPAKAWSRISTGAGAHGPREYDWARLPVRVEWTPGRGHWLLARRSITDPTEIAYYVCYGPRTTRLLDLARTAGSRWRIEECFQQAKNDAGLDHYQVRTWRAWYAHITLAMAAHAWLVAARTLAAKGETGSDAEPMIGYTVPEIRRLLVALVLRHAHRPERIWTWSAWRRRRQHQARLCHYRRRGYPIT